MSLGGLFGKKRNYASEYAGYRPNQPASIFEQYVDETPDLLAAWNQIQDDPSGTQGSYWIPRGASSKAAFGRAHAAEDAALAGGTYQGGTDVAPWTGGTRFEGFLDLLSGGGGGDTGPGPLGQYTGNNPYYPVMDTQYSAPAGGGLLADAYAPWSEASLDYVPESIWSGAETAPLTGLGYGVEYNAPRFGPITIPVPETEGTSGTSGTTGTTTDASGNKWVITPQGQWISADSDYGQALAADNANYYQHYDQSGAYVGAGGSGYITQNNQGVFQINGEPMFTNKFDEQGNQIPMSGAQVAKIAGSMPPAKTWSYGSGGPLDKNSWGSTVNPVFTAVDEDYQPPSGG